MHGSTKDQPGGNSRWRSASLQPVILGLVAGLAIAFWTGRFLERFLFDVRTFDVVTYLATAGSVLVLSLLACAIPSLRAARLSPTVALRHD